jgi:hypothetical protein
MINGPDVGMAIPAHVVKQFLREVEKAQPALQITASSAESFC